MLDDAPTGPTGPEPAELAAALEHANLPSLVPALYQLTGDRRWLAAPFRPTRSRGMEDNDGGGFAPEVAAEIRAAALDAVLAHRAGRPLAVPAPAGAELRALLSLAVGEEVPPEYARMAAEDMGFAPDPAPGPAPAGDAPTVLVIGAGVSGMLAAIELDRAGIEHVVLEKNDDVGGTWLENAYPGAGVDTPSHLYSYSFAPRSWSTHFGRRDEVLGYLRDVAEHYGLRERIRFGTEVVDAAYDERACRWTVRTGTGDELHADVVITAVGQLNRPKDPDLPGRAGFRGRVVHTAEWPADLDLTGRRVAVVGTGASAMQVVPAVAARTGHLTVFQRSPHWIAPNEAYFAAIPDAVNLLMRRVPSYRAWYRFRLSWNTGDRVHPALQVDPDWEHPGRSVNAVNDAHRRVFTRYLESRLEGRPDLVEKALPDYPPFGKRMLLDNGWFDALRRDDVDLVTEAVERFTPTGLRGTGGTEVEADVVVLATGFRTTRFLYPMEVRGRGGAGTAEVWGDDDATAHLGIATAGFPNLFLTCGPGTVLGHGGSYITIAECQVRYIVDLLVRMARAGVAEVEVRPEVERGYVDRHDAAHDAMIWTHPGMGNWYRNDDGRVVSALPWRIVDYWAMTRQADLAEYRTRDRAARSRA